MLPNACAIPIVKKKMLMEIAFQNDVDMVHYNVILLETCNVFATKDIKVLNVILVTWIHVAVSVTLMKMEIVTIVNNLIMELDVLQNAKNLIHFTIKIMIHANVEFYLH